MGFEAKIIADSMSPQGVRLTTFEVTFPRIVLAEFNTHRMFSRNSASSRAIPVQRMISRVMDDPYVPTSWGKNQRGMQADVDLDDREASKARSIWLHARDAAVDKAEKMLDIGVHKQLTNRLLEPFMWHTCLVTATEWSNFFHLRNNKDAHPDIQIPAAMMQELYETNTPRPVAEGEWHLPLIDDEDHALWSKRTVAVDDLYLQKISVARCARVSYLTHDGQRDHDKDLELHERLLSSGHMSPFEHAARPMTEDDPPIVKTGFAGATVVGTQPGEPMRPMYWCGNFRGWVQYRKTIPNEWDMLRPT